MGMVKEYLHGFIDSIRFDIFLRMMFTNEQYKNAFLIIMKHNIIVYCIPELIMYLFSEIKYVVTLYNFVFYFLKIYIFANHIMYHQDVLNINSQFITSKQNMNIVDSVATTITLSLYLMLNYLIFSVINYFITDQHILIYWIGISISFFLLSIYHAFYCYNNLWQLKGYNYSNRILLFEIDWAYNLGYGTILTILYMKTYPKTNVLYRIVYNMYMVMTMTLPFLINAKKDINWTPYFRLRIVSYVLSLFYKIINLVITL